YNGLVFKGFVAGVPEGLLSGGEYNGLMRKMGKSQNAIGFAVYLDALERLLDNGGAYDVDTVVIYDSAADLSLLSEAIESLTAAGQTVMARRAVPEKLRYQRLLKFDSKEGRLLEANA
ncbi:MAG: ATP phosphoribosyltransferase regulatory subunit, partial [Clostridia bacterium]|nr:ATP phosphoribosyltransferase regulatory subunit [Clostridia bacterium]